MSRNAPYVAEGPGGVDDFQKLKVDSDGKLLTAGTATFTGTVSQAGASGGLKTKKLIIGDTPTLIKTDLVTRDSMSARVMGTNVVYVGASDVTVDKGYPKFQYEEIIADVQSVAATSIYGVCETGKTCEVRVLEIDA